MGYTVAFNPSPTLERGEGTTLVISTWSLQNHSSIYSPPPFA